MAGAGTKSIAAIPRLTIRRPNGTIELFEDQFLDQPWKLSDCDSELTEVDFSDHFDSGQTGQVDVTTEARLDIQFTRNLRRQLRLVGVEKGWDFYGLVNWLDRQIPHPDITAADSRLFMLRVVEGLLSNRSLKVEQLAQQKYRLREALTAKIERYRRSQLRLAFQQVLFESGNAVVAMQLSAPRRSSVFIFMRGPTHRTGTTNRDINLRNTSFPSSAN